MTDRLQALKELLAKVEAGDITYNDFRETCSILKGMHGRAFEAYSGSLDGAKDLNEAVLPEYDLYQIDHEECSIGNAVDDFSAPTNNNPARAWLIAIIKALITQEEAKCS